MVSNNGQSFGKDPVTVRDTGHYEDEYVGSFVDKWDELIDWDRRAKSEGDFFIKHLQERGVKRVLDVATGTGFHSIRLIEAGFEVVSVDGSAEMLGKAFSNGRDREHVLRTVQADWRFLNRDVHGEFDAIICLGNSFTHMFKERDRRKALAEFYAMLKHDGLLVLDQRNYDSILDEGFDSKHTYYYCGEDVTAAPEYVDEGLARFRYTFPDGSSFHLNMFPLRKDYTRRLMREVGFQTINTYGDFQETYHDEEPDFFVHVAEKHYEQTEPEPEPDRTTYSKTVNTARKYYNSDDADNFYHAIWGGEDIHVGLYESADQPIADASRRTVAHLASMLGDITDKHRILDVGSGYGGAARHLAKTFGCHVTCLNLSEVENDRNREMNIQAKLDNLIDVVDGSFEDLPFNDEKFHIAWSQDAILHSGNRVKVLAEINRVLKEEGQLIFTDPMQSDDCPEGVLDPILERIHLETLASPAFYRVTAQSLGMKQLQWEPMTHHLVTHYSRVLHETQQREDKLHALVSEDYIKRMKNGLRHWIDGGKQGYLAWGVMHFAK